MWVDRVGLLAFKSSRSLLGLMVSLLTKGRRSQGANRNGQPSSAATASISIRASGIARFEIWTSVLAGGFGPKNSRGPPPTAPPRPRVRPEELRAHLAVRLTIAYVGDEHGDLDDIAHCAATGLDDHLDLLEDAACLRPDVAP